MSVMRCTALVAAMVGPILIAGPPPAGVADPPTLAAPPPALDGGTQVLFDGGSWSQWRTRDGDASPWRVQGDGSVTVAGGDAISEREFGDFQLHLEFMCPDMTGRDGQARANSGLYLHGRYEVQVLDSWGQAPAANGCGAVYSIAPPLVNASRAPGAWQTYDVVFRAPRLDGDGTMLEAGRVTVIHNGVVIHNNLELPKATPGGLDLATPARGPILLQDHGDPIRYRNIWVREL